MPGHEKQIANIHYSLGREINEFYWAVTIRSFAIGLLGVFVPIYMYLLFDKSISTTLFFYFVQYAGLVLTVPLAAKLIKRLGVKKMMAIANPFLALYIVFLMLAKDVALGLIIGAILAKIVALSFYWPAYHIDFARFSKAKKRGRQLGTINILMAFAKALAPLIAGFAIIQFGFIAVFTVAAILLSLASIPLFFSPEVYEEYTLGWAETYRRVFKKENLRTSSAMFFQGAEYFAGLFFFPIFIYTVIGQLDIIGWITSVSLFVAMGFTYFIGRLTDKQGSAKVIDVSSLFHSIAWIISALISTPVQYLIYSSILRVTEIASHLSFHSRFYDLAKKRGHGIDEYVIFFQTAHNLGRAAIALVAVIGFAAGWSAWWFYFLLAGISAFSFQLFNRRQDTLWAQLKRKFS